MTRVPRWSSKKLQKRLKELGAQKLPGKRGKGSHVMYERRRDDGTIGRTPVPTSCDVILPKTLRSILTALGLTQEDLLGD